MSHNKIIKIVPIDDSKFMVELVLGNVCNYKCYYCFPGSNEGTHRWPNFDLITKNLEKIFVHFLSNTNKTNIDLKIIGGEPTLWNKLPNFVKFLKDRFNIKITISTNASRTIRYWKEISKYIDDIQISVHHEYADLNHIIEVSNYIYETKQSILSVNVLMDPFNFEKCLGIVNYLKTNSNNWMIAMIPVQFNGETIYDENQMRIVENKNVRMPPFEWIENLINIGKLADTKDANKSIATYEDGSTKVVSGQYLVVNKLNYFKDYDCGLGIDRIFIDQNGLVGGATGCVLFDNQLNVYDTNIDDRLSSIKLEPIKCIKHICSCSPETMITKEYRGN